MLRKLRILCYLQSALFSLSSNFHPPISRQNFTPIYTAVRSANSSPSIRALRRPQYHPHLQTNSHSIVGRQIFTQNVREIKNRYLKTKQMQNFTMNIRKIGFLFFLFVLNAKFYIQSCERDVTSASSKIGEKQTKMQMKKSLIKNSWKTIKKSTAKLSIQSCTQ